MSAIQPIGEEYRFSVAGRAALSALIVLIIGIAAAVFVVQFKTHLLLTEKLVIPVLTSYAIVTALVSIGLLALIFLKKQVQLQQENSVPVFEIEVEESCEELENTGINPSPFLPSDTTPISHLKQDPNPPVENTLRKTAKEKLVDAKKYAAAVDWKQFALMNNTSLIKDSSLEGHQTYGCFTAYLNYLTVLEKEGSFFSTDHDKNTLQALHEALTTARNIMTYFPKCRASVLPEKDLENAQKNILSILNTELMKKGYVYFPAGYCGRENGHAVGCKITLDSKRKQVTISLLNLGEGSEIHPVLDANTHAMKCSYSYYPTVISTSEWNALAPTFLRHLLRFISDLPHEKKCYSTQDLYDLLAVFRSHDTSYINDHAEKLAAKQQHVGDCPEKAVRTMITDFFFMQRNCSQENVNTLFLNLHFTSIFSAYYSFIKAPQALHRDLLVNGCEEFLNVLQRSKKLLQEAEYIEAAEVIDLILKQVRAKTIEASPTIIPPKVAVPTRFTPIKPPNKVSFDQIKNDKPPKPKSINLPSFKAATFKRDWEAFLNTVLPNKADEVSDNYLLLITQILSLPIPQWSVTDEWDKIPANQIPFILGQIRQITGKLKSDVGHEKLAILTLYAVADKLIRRIDKSGDLKKYAFPFPLEWTEKYLFFMLGSEVSRFQQIKEYFLESKRAAKGTIYPYPKDWKNVSPELEAVLLLAGKSLTLAEGESFDQKKLKECKSWDGLGTEHIMDPTLETKLIQFFYKYKDLSLNDLHCKPKNFQKIEKGQEKKELFATIFDNEEREQLTPELLDELMILLHQPKLQIGSVIQWMERHFNELHKPVVQHIIQLALFSSGALKERLKETPEVLKELRALFDKGLNHYGNNLEVYPASLFLIRCGLTLESYASEFLQIPIDKSETNRYKQRLDALFALIDPATKNSIHHTYYLQNLLIHLFLDSLTPPTSLEEFTLVYTRLFKALTITGEEGYGGSRDILTLWRELPTIQYNLLSQFRNYLDAQKGKKQETLNTLCNTVLTNLSGDSIWLEWSWKEGDSSCSSELCMMNFLNGQIYHGKKGCKLYSLMPSEKKSFQLQEFGVNFNEIWWYQSINYHYPVISSFDEKTVITYTHAGEAFLLKEKGVVCPSTVANFGKGAKKFPILNSHRFKHFCLNDSGKDYVLSSLRKDNKPYMRIDYLPDGMTCRKVDEKGNPLPYILANLAELQPTDPLYAYTLRYAHANDVHCFIDEKTEDIEEVHFSRMGLTFKRNGTRLESKEYLGYFLTPLEVKALHGCSQNAMVLRNNEGKVKVILPTPKKEKKEFNDTKERKVSQLHEKGFYNYDLDSLDAPMTGKKGSEHLFLIYFLKAHGELEAAQRELNQLHVYTMDEDLPKVAYYFLRLRDHTPRSLAFTLKLLLFIVDHYHLICGYERKSYSDDFKKTLEDACGWYVGYLRAASDDTVNGIPIESRLSEDEEARILLILKREGIELPKILKIRKELLLSQDRTAEVKFKPQKISLTPACFKNVKPPTAWKNLHRLRESEKLPFGQDPSGQMENYVECPNQASATYCQQHFVKLYEEATRVPVNCKTDRFDFKLLALLRNPKTNTVSAELAYLLFYVRSFPHYFKDYSLSGASEAWQRIVFNGILEQVHSAYLVLGKDNDQERIHKKEKFGSKKKITLSLPDAPELSAQPLPHPFPLNINTKPFEDCRKLLFKRTTTSSTYGKEQLFEPSLLERSPLEKEICAKFERAHEKLASLKNTTYAYQEKNRGKVEQELERRRAQFVEKCEQEKKYICESINDPFNTFLKDFTTLEEAEFRLRLNARQTYKITPEMLMQEVILKDSTAFLDQHRPMLRPDHVKAIVAAVNRYYHLIVLSSMCKQGLELLTEMEKSPSVESENALLELLNYEFLYAPEKYPEIAYMQVKTGKLPRKDQALAYKWICEGFELNEKRHFQLSAGGGKTSYLIPLMILRSRKHNQIPIVMTTQAMYGIEKENLRKTLSLLGIELDTLEIGMHTELTLDALKIIRDQFVAALHCGKALIMTPQTYYALRLNYFKAAIEKNNETSAFLEEILGFFKSKGVVLGDESHRNWDPVTQAIFGIGEFVKLQRQEEQLLMTLAKPLFGIEKLVTAHGVELSSLTNSISKENISLIKKALSEHLLKTFFKQIPPKEHQAIIHYWLNRQAAEPTAITQMEGKERYLMHLARYFFTTLLKETLQKKTDLDHVRSPEQGDIDTPSHYKTPSHAQFKEHYLTFLFSVKGTWHRGLDRGQFTVWIEALKKLDLKEQELASNLAETPTKIRFKTWMQGKFPHLTLEHFDLNNQQQFEEVFAFCSKNPLVIQHYLNSQVLHLVGYSAEEFTSSPSHLMDGFHNGIFFSATPLDLAYPRAVKQFRQDEEFEAKVIAQSSRPKNQNFFHPKDSGNFFEIISRERQKYSHKRRIVDAGGFLCRELNSDVAQKWLAASDLDGVIYFKDGAGTYGEKLCFRLKNSATVYEFAAVEELKARLKKENIKWETLKIGKYFDAAHAESAHFDPEPNTGSFILVGEGLTLSHAIQSIMRDRGFLNEAMNTSITWVVQEDLKAKMQGKCPDFSSRILHTYFLKKEVKARKKRIIMAAFQDIIFQIETLALKTHIEKRHSIVAHEAGFRNKIVPQDSWGSQKRTEETKTVLWKFAEKHYARFAFKTPFDQNVELKKVIEKTIQETEQKITHLVVDCNKNASSEMHQRCIVSKQVQTVRYKHNPDGLNAEPVVKRAKIKQSDYPALIGEHAISVRDLFKLPNELSENFYIEFNQLETANRYGKPLKESFLKPIDFLLVIAVDQGKYLAEAISSDVLPKYIKHLDQQINDKNIHHQAFIIRADGVLYHRGKGSLAPSESTISTIMQSEWLEDVLIDTALLNGKIRFNDRFKERVRRWPNFMSFWKQILNALKRNQEISVSALYSFMPEMEES